MWDWVLHQQIGDGYAQTINSFNSILNTGIYDSDKVQTIILMKFLNGLGNIYLLCVIMIQTLIINFKFPQLLNMTTEYFLENWPT